MAKTKKIDVTLPTEITFVINEEKTKKLAEWKAAHNVIYGYCDDSEYDYVFTVDGDSCTIKVKNTYHDTEIDLTDETSW